MSSVYRSCLLVLTILFSIGMWQAGICQATALQAAWSESSDATGTESDTLPATDGEAPEENRSAVDDVFEVAPAPSYHPDLSACAAKAPSYRWADGLSRGRPASEAPFKPPRV